MGTPAPQVILGDALTGRGSDNARSAFGKYNVHSHGIATAANFLCTGIQPGMVVEPASDCATRSFIEGAAVQSLTSQQLTLTDPALRSDVDASLLIGETLYNGLKLTKDSRNITRNPANGFLDAGNLSSIQTETVAGVTHNPVGGLVYPIVIKTSWPGVLDRVCIQALAGACTVEVLLNDLSIKTFTNLTGLGQHTFAQELAGSTYFPKQSTIALRFGSTLEQTIFTYTFYVIKLGV